MLASTGNVLAQQGIGTNTPHRSAALQIDSQNKGLLIPRVNITDENSSNPISGNVPEGLMVYNKGEVTGSIAKGFYYWASGKWNSFLTSQNSENTDTKTQLVDGDHTEVSLLPTNSIFLDNVINTYKVDVNVATKPDNGEATFGVVKPGEGLSIDSYGNLNVNFPVTEDLNAITKVEKVENQEYVTVASSPNPIGNTGERTYTVGVNKATKPDTGEATFGVVKPGEGLSIDTFGNLNVNFPVTEDLDTKTKVAVTGPITLSQSPVAFTENDENTFSLGLNIGDGLSVDNNGALHVTVVDTDTKTSVVNSLTTTVAAPTLENGVLVYKVEVNNLQGDVTGTIESTKVEKIQNILVNPTVPDVDQVLVAKLVNGTTKQWVPTTIETTDTVTTLSTDQNYVTITPNPVAPLAGVDRDYKIGVNKATKPLTGEATYGVVKPGAGLSIAENGTLKVDFPVESITVSNISTDNTLTTTVNNVTGNAVSLVKTNTLSLGTGNNSKQLTSTVNGISATLDLSSIDTNTTYTANNGVKIENNVVKLGGDLSEPTTIKNVGSNVLKLEGLSNTKQVESVVNTSNNTLTSSTINKVLVVDANHTVKTVNAVMPEFFYMPSIVINTAATTVDLYQQYLNQFGNPMISNTNNEGKLPVLNRNMLDYHVTYYDNNVLTNVSINDNGVMNYGILPSANLNLTFINVVFKVRAQPNTSATSSTTNP